jgi:hypothetical protein
MAKRSYDSGGSSTVKVEEVKLEKVSDVPLRLLMSATYKYVGKREYVWNGAGSVVAVHPDDVEKLLEKVRNSSCCAGTPGGNVFEKVDGK